MRPELANLIQRAQELNDDFELTAVRAWKESVPGRKAIGHMPIYIPRELIHAAGMLPVGIVGAGERLEIIRGDAYFQSYICHIPRSTIELALSRRLDVLDGMLFPSICDVIRNLSGMWTMLFPERYVRYVDLPQNFEPGAGGVYWRRELEILREDFGRLSGRRVEDAALRSSIAVYNENRSTIRELYSARSHQPWVYPISEVYALLRVGNLLPPEGHTELLRKYLQLAPLETERRNRDQSRVVLVGMFCEQPPIGLLLTLERAGCWVVDDDLFLGMRWITGEISCTGDPMQALVAALDVAALLMEQRELEEKIAGLEANQRTVPDRLAEFLELAGTAYFQYKLALPDEKRDLLEMVTSNRRVNGRNVELTLSLPFSEEKTL